MEYEPSRRDVLAATAAAVLGGGCVEEMRQTVEPFEVTKTDFPGGEPQGCGDYPDNPFNTYGPRDTVYMYNEIENATLEDGRGAVRFEVYIDGPGRFEEQGFNTIEFTGSGNTMDRCIWHGMNPGLLGFPEGRYDVYGRISDAMSDQDDSFDGTFYIDS